MNRTNYLNSDGYYDDYIEDGRPRPMPALLDKDRPFRTFMHYTDPEARQDPITVFGARQAPGRLFYNYSDRLPLKEWREGAELADKAGITPRTARWFEAVLNHVHGVDDVDLGHVLLGVNQSSGYHYLVFGYTYGKQRKAQAELERQRAEWAEQDKQAKQTKKAPANDQ